MQVAVSSKEVLSGVSLSDIEELANENSSLRGYLHGYIAELFLKRHLLSIPGVDSVEKIPDHHENKGDFLVSYCGKNITVEAKSLLSNGVKQDPMTGSILGKVSLKKGGVGKGETSTCLPRGQFDILAICTFSATKKWEYLFIHNKFIPSSLEDENMLTSKITLDLDNTPKLTSDAASVFNETIRIIG